MARFRFPAASLVVGPAGVLTSQATGPAGVLISQALGIVLTPFSTSVIDAYADLFTRFALCLGVGLAVGGLDAALEAAMDAGLLTVLAVSRDESSSSTMLPPPLLHRPWQRHSSTSRDARPCVCDEIPRIFLLRHPCVLLRFFCVAAAHCPQWEKKEESPDTSGENSDSPYPPLTP